MFFLKMKSWWCSDNYTSTILIWHMKNSIFPKAIISVLFLLCFVSKLHSAKCWQPPANMQVCGLSLRLRPALCRTFLVVKDTQTPGECRPWWPEKVLLPFVTSQRVGLHNWVIEQTLSEKDVIFLDSKKYYEATLAKVHNFGHVCFILNKRESSNPPDNELNS